MLEFFRYSLFKLRRKKFLQQKYSAVDPWSSALSAPQISKIINQRLADLHFDSAVDIGCGEGQFTHVFKAHSESYLGIDVNETAIQRARAQSQLAGVEFRTLDFDGLGGLGRKFDLFVFNFVLDYLGFAEYPRFFAARLFAVLQTCAASPCHVLIINPIYKKADWERIQKYQFLFESFGFVTLKREMLAAPDIEFAVLLMRKSKTR